MAGRILPSDEAFKLVVESSNHPERLADNIVRVLAEERANGEEMAEIERRFYDALEREMPDGLGQTVDVLLRFVPRA